MSESKPCICPLTISKAQEFVNEHHRHHKAPQGGLFAVGLSLNGELVGAAIIGRPVARMSNDGYTAEVTRLCVTDNIPNGCSMLYGAASRAAKSLGYKKLITFILDTEPGTSLKASGWTLVGQAGGGTWNRTGRPRVDKHPTQKKFKFQKELQ